jgi:hypothetical protein
MVAVVTVAAFSNADHDTFVNDDKFFTIQSGSLNLQSVGKFFQEHAWSASGVSSDIYRPLLLLSLTVEGLIHGGQARSFHLTNIALHVGTTLLLLRVLLKLLGDTKAARLPAAMAALIFGLHPIHTEVVNSIFNRSEMLSTLGVLGATAVVLHWSQTHPYRAWGAAAGIYFAALLCRESAAPLPVLVLIVLVSQRSDIAFTRDGLRRLARALAPALILLVVTGVYLLIRQVALATPTGLDISAALPEIDPPPPALAPAFDGLQWLSRLGNSLRMLREGARLVLWPHPLRAIYYDLGNGGPWNALVIFCFTLALTIPIRKTAPGILLGLAFFCVALLPSTRFLSGGSSHAIAERYLYLPSVGLSLTLAFLLQKWMTGAPRWLPVGAIGGIAAVFFSLSVTRNADWRSEVTLWEAEARATPQHAEPWQFLVIAYRQSGRLADAGRICDAQLEPHAKDGILQTNCGVIYDDLNRTREAEAAYQRAITAGQGAMAYANLGRFYARIGRPKDAEGAYRQAVQVETNPARRHYRQGQFLLRFYPARTEEAKAEFERALELQPRFGPARAALEGLRQR